MGALIAVGSVLMYLFGSAITFRIIYRSFLEDLYKERNECGRCKSNMGYYRRGDWDRELVACRDHQLLKTLKEPAIIGAIFWPLTVVGAGFYYLGKGTAKLTKKIAFPSGVQTPSKLIWEQKLQEARIERQQRELEAQHKELERK